MYELILRGSLQYPVLIFTSVKILRSSFFDELYLRSLPSPLPSDVEEYLLSHITATVRGEGQNKDKRFNSQNVKVNKITQLL